MNNLERKLIELTFPTVNVDALMEIIVATPNSRVATEILCGVYQEPDFVKEKIDSNDRLRTFTHYDKWTEQVHYAYLEPEIVYAYFPNSVDKNTITLDNYKSLRCDYSDNTYRHGVKTGKMLDRTSSCTVDTWNAYKNYKFELSAEEIEATL